MNRHLADLIKKQRTAVGLLKAPRTALHRSGKRAPFVTEQLALNQSLWQRCGINCNKRAITAGGQLVDFSRD
jgi:hypothetical protein